MSLTLWDVTVSRDRGGERWRWPRVEAGRGNRKGRWGIRIGWRWTAWGLHFGRMEVTRDEADAVLAAAEKVSCPRHVSLWGRMLCPVCTPQPVRPEDVPERCPHGRLSIDPCVTCTADVDWDALAERGWA